VSPIPPKTCSYSCAYCQLGRTNHLQIKRESFFPREDILSEIVKRTRETNPAYVTFVGDGEPTLNADIGWLIEQTRKSTGVPVAVITNGSLLWHKDVRSELLQADVVIPTLDAGNERTFKRISRPHRDIRFDSMVQGLIDFSHDYRNQLWIEVMLVKGANDSEQELLSIKAILERVHHQRVYVLTPIRPPAESWVKQPDSRSLLRAQFILGGSITLANLESGDFGLNDFISVRDAISEIGSRHPLRREQAERIAATFSERGAIEQMLNERVLLEVEYEGIVYLLPGHFLRGTAPRS
jgi:wyosine [tRNA(Phe)-imidazoG37] synthetase (radical SAM superfamily)